MEREGFLEEKDLLNKTPIEPLVYLYPTKSQERQSLRLTKKGKEVAYSFWQELLAKLPEEYSLRDLKEKAQQFFEEKEGRREYDKDFLRLCERSFAMRIERLHQEKIFAEISASNSAWSELVYFLKETFYEHRPLEFAKNFLMTKIVRLKESFDQALVEFSSSLAHPELANYSLFRRYLEEKVVEKIKELVAEKRVQAPDMINPILIKTIIEKYLGSYEASFGYESQGLKEINEQDVKNEPRVFLEKPKQLLLSAWEGLRKKAKRAYVFLSLCLFLHRNVTSTFGKESFVPPKPVVLKALNPEREEEELERKLSRLSLPVLEIPSYREDEIIMDETFIYPGSKLATADLLRRIDTLTKELFGENSRPSAELTERYLNTVNLLRSAKQKYPQCPEFQVTQIDNRISLEPINWQEKIEVKREENADILIAGGELESLAAAIRAAKEGKKVILLYQGALGGLSSDSGGNMRYFDAVDVETTEEQSELLHKALGMPPDNLWSIPDNASEKLLSYLEENYPSISLVKTNLDALHIEKENERISAVITQEGIKIIPSVVLDTDPEAVISEKAGLPLTIETPNLAYGCVFDLEGIDASTIEKLKNPEALEPKNIFRLLGINSVEEFLASHPELKDLSKKLEKDRYKDTKSNRYIAWGFVGLAEAYKLYMAALEALSVGPQKEALAKLNSQRIVDGFNVAFHENNKATFNSLSYRFEKVIRQGRHNTSQFPLVITDAYYFEDFLRKLSENNNVKIRLPKELYVRQSTFSILTIHPYNREDFFNLDPNSLMMSYPLDARGETARHPWDEAGARVYEEASQIENPSWNIKPQSAATEIPNLFVVSKNSIPPSFPCFRIIQNLIGTAVLVVKNLPRDYKEGKMGYEYIPKIPYIRPAEWVPAVLRNEGRVGIVNARDGFPVLSLTINQAFTNFEKNNNNNNI